MKSYISALGRFRPSDLNAERMTATLFGNVFAKLKIPYDNLPSYFEVIRGSDFDKVRAAFPLS